MCVCYCALVRYPNGVVEHYYCAKGNLTRSEASPGQPSTVTSNPQDSITNPLVSSLEAPGVGGLTWDEAAGMDFTSPLSGGLEDGYTENFF